MRAGDLTSLDSVKRWLSITGEESDDLLSRLISGASAFVLNYLNRKGLGLQQFVEVYDGYGNTFMVLRQNPVFNVLSISCAGTVISPVTGDGITQQFSNGFHFQPGEQRIDLYGHWFPRARGSIVVRYSAGYVASNEEHTIPSSSPYVVTPDFVCLGDVHVDGPNGEVYNPVASSPTTGQYVYADGKYTFSAEDEGKTVLISYSYVPYDLEQAVYELVGERYRYMDRIGYTSKSLGGQETVSFSSSAMSSYVSNLLIPYRNVVPA